MLKRLLYLPSKRDPMLSVIKQLTLVWGFIPLVLQAGSAINTPGNKNTDSSIVVTSDHIRYELLSFIVNDSTNTAVAELTLTSLKAHDRELKINVYGTSVTDTAGKSHLFSQLRLGQVTISLKDRQNYLHYLLKRDISTKMIITFEAFPDQTTVKTLKLTVESSIEQGRFDDIIFTGI